MPSRKMNSAILGANGGLDSARALSHARNVMMNHGLSGAVLYQFVVTGSQDIGVYQKVIKSLMRKIRNHGCRLEYFGAYEKDEVKGMHAHCFVIIETSKNSPIGILNVNDGAYLHKLAVRHGINRIHLSKPKNPIHGGQFFARMNTDQKLANCLEWIEYAYKVRSKDGIAARENYFNSEFKANKAKRVKPSPTLKKEIQNAEQFETQSEASREERSLDSTGGKSSSTEAKDSMQLTEAGFKYLGGIYESCVDQGLNILDIQRQLNSKGINRSLRQVRHDLDNVFVFPGYVEAHPAPPRDDVSAFDAAAIREPVRAADSRLNRGSILVSSDLPPKQPSYLVQKILYRT